MGLGVVAPPRPPRPPAHPKCRGAKEGLGAQGRVSAPSSFPWPRRGLPERPVGANVAPDPYEPPPPHSRRYPPSPEWGTGSPPWCARWMDHTGLGCGIGRERVYFRCNGLQENTTLFSPVGIVFFC